MFLITFGLLLLAATGIKAELWKLPTAVDVQTSLEICQITNLLFLNLSENDGNSDRRCFAKALGLWSDDEGFKAKRFMKFLNRHHQPIEILVVVNYCNNSHKQTDLDKWANEAFSCFAKGHMGSWINEYIQNVYKKKVAT